MECKDKKNICFNCPRSDVCMAKYGICSGLECPINAFDQQENRQMTKIDTILDIFFGISDGELPEKYLKLKSEYLDAKKELGKGCSSCQLNSLVREYKKKVKEIS